LGANHCRGCYREWPQMDTDFSPQRRRES
jgi:hypothetical protein